jgi:hypothetical protein
VNIRSSAKESLGYYELRKDKPWFDEGCSKLSDQRREAKLQCLQYPSEIMGDYLCNVGREASRHFRNKREEYPKDTVYEFAMNSTDKNKRYLYRGIN